MKLIRAGALRAGYENGFVRRISHGETEVLRMIYFALRDHNWNTVMSKIENEILEIGEDRFSIRYDCVNHDGGVSVMRWKGRIEGRADGTIVFEIYGEVLEDFRRNRAGFCVLHPLSVAGSPCTLTHPGGKKETLLFPVEVAPDDPFKNIEAMEWTAGGVPYSLTYEGDLFETEDQRNWSDASYKTFCTPLDRPFPVPLRPGDKVFQRVTFRPQRALSSTTATPSHVMLKDGPSGIFPALGMAASTEVDRLTEDAVSAIRSLRLRHYRVEVIPSADDWVRTFSREYETGFGLGLPLEVALHLSDHHQEEIEAFVVLCLQNKVRLRKILLLSAGGLVTGGGIIRSVPRLKEAFPNVLVGVGTNYNFNEINKNRFSSGQADYISFSIDPQEHAFDDLTILENIEAQQHLIASARSIYGEAMPVHVSPLTLRKRFNPYATNREDLVIAETLKADPRQQQDFAALWTFGSLCSLTRGGAAAVTLFQTAGGQGILSKKGVPYPVYEVVRNLSSWSGRRVTSLESSDSIAIQGILLDGKTLALANYTHESKVVRYGSAEFTVPPREIQFELNRA